MSIGKALFALLTTDDDLSELIGNRVSAVKFRRGEEFPALTYNTDNIKSLPCRDPGPERRGILELAILTDTYEEMESVESALSILLDNRTHEAALMRLTFSEGRPDYTEDADELKALYKRIEYDLTTVPI